MRVMASDLAAIRAEGRRLLADFYAFGTEDDGFRRDRLIDFWYDHADALLADPPDSLPEGDLAARARVAELEAENARLTEALESMVAPLGAGGPPDERIDVAWSILKATIGPDARATLAGGAQTEAPAEGEEG